MARPEKKDVDYFPFYVKDGRTLHILEDKYACKGTGFFTNVCRFLSERPDHHFSIASASDKLWFFSQTKCDEESGVDMLNIMAITGKIENDLWDKKVIASQAFLDSITDAYRKRTNNIITMEQIKEIYGVSGVVNTQVSEFPAEDTTCEGITTADNPQSIVKESKEDKRKENIYEHFEKFWLAYPKKKNKGTAEKAFKKINPSKKLLETILLKIEQAKLSKDWIKKSGQYIPYPASWLNAMGWEDEYNTNPLDGVLSDKGQATVRNLQSWMQDKEEEEQLNERPG